MEIEMTRSSGLSLLPICIHSVTKSLGFRLIVEGMANNVKLDFLPQHECAIYQGWLFEKLTDAAALTKRIRIDACKLIPVG